MTEQSIFTIFEAAVVVVEIFTVYIFQSGYFKANARPGWQRALAYLLFGLVLATFSMFNRSMLWLPIITFLGVFCVSFFSYQGHVFAHIFAAFLYLMVGVAMEMLVSGLHSLLLGATLAEIHSLGVKRLLGITTSKMVNLAIIKLIVVIMRKHKEYQAIRIWETVPIVLCQVVLIFLMTGSFINAYNEYGLLTVRTLIEIIGIFFVNIVIFWYYDILVNSYELKHRNEITAIQLEDQLKYYDTVQSQLDTLGAIDHDIKKHVAVLEGLIAAGQNSEAVGYAASLKNTITENAGLVFAPHPVVSAILSNCAQRAKKIGAQVKLDVRISPNIAVSNVDLTTIMGNTIDNAIEALYNLPGEKDRLLTICLKQDNHFLFYEITNTYDAGSMKKKDNGKHRRGYGLKNVESCVNKYGGECTRNNEGGVFSISIFLNSKIQE